jgi:hypothetical protein
MRIKNIAIIVVVVILVCAIGVGAYYMLQPQYKTISMSGITLEVPNSNASVVNNSVNYNTYNDQENNLSVKTWVYRDVNDANGTAQAVLEIGTQYGLNMAQNVTYDNVSVSNKSGTYSYYETDETNKCIILITGTNIDQVTHAVKSINKTEINPVGGNITLENMTNNTTANNTTISSDTSTTQKTSQATSTKKSSSKSKQSSDDGVERDADAPYGRAGDGTPFTSDSEREQYIYDMSH